MSDKTKTPEEIIKHVFLEMFEFRMADCPSGINLEATIKCIELADESVKDKTEELEKRLSQAEFSATRWEEKCDFERGRVNSLESQLSSAKDSIEEMKEYLLEAGDALSKYSKASSALYISNWNDQQAMRDLIYNCHSNKFNEFLTNYQKQK
jgi:chromosome segregation ATPase